VVLDFLSETPIYQQIAEEIESAIITGAYEEGTQVPSTTEISIQYKINPATVLKGITLLADEGILYKKRGVGMFVAADARVKVLDKRKEAFFGRYVLPLVKEAKKLDIAREEIVNMIGKGYEK
jgi:DNA-binding transcriptional regulator YhcF (GntR family)